MYMNEKIGTEDVQFYKFFNNVDRNVKKNSNL